MRSLVSNSGFVRSAVAMLGVTVIAALLAFFLISLGSGPSEPFAAPPESTVPDLGARD
jgi:hypothetical protein